MYWYMYRLDIVLWVWILLIACTSPFLFIIGLLPSRGETSRVEAEAFSSLAPEVWDIRTKSMVCALTGHDNTVYSVFARPTDPQVVTGSHDTTIKFWDLVAGKTMATLTRHKKSVRAMALHPKEHAFSSASADNIKKFSLPKGEFLHNMLSQQKTIINSMSVNEDGVLATGGK